MVTDTLPTAVGAHVIADLLEQATQAWEHEQAARQSAAVTRRNVLRGMLAARLALLFPEVIGQGPARAALFELAGINKDGHPQLVSHDVLFELQPSAAPPVGADPYSHSPLIVSRHCSRCRTFTAPRTVKDLIELGAVLAGPEPTCPNCPDAAT